MFEFPDLKFEKSCNYLENQLQLHNDNKERILDIINNANLDSKNAENIKSSCYANFVDDATKVLETISNNISTIESLNSQLKNLNVELNSIVAIEPPGTKAKKFYVKTCTDLKDNLITYSKNFEEMESKLNLDNIYFTEFINKANYSYVTTINTDENEIGETFEDIEFSINKDFLEKIENTSSFEFEDISYVDTDNNSVSSPIFILEDLSKSTPVTSEETIDPELEIDKLLNLLNDLNSGDVLLLSLDIPNDNQISTDITSPTTTIEAVDISENINNENNLEVIEHIEIQEEFAEEIRKIEKLIDKELIPEIKNIEEFTNTPEVLENTIENQFDEESKDIIKEDLEKTTVETKRKLTFKKAKKTKKENLTKDSFIEKIENIKNAVNDNKTLLISERLGEIYLPYKKSELLEYIEENPKTYKSLQDVVKQEFTLPFQFFRNQSSKLRFTETYNLLKNKDKYGFFKSASYAVKIATKKSLNPVIIAACRSKYELESYVYYLDSNNLNNFRFFDIIYEVNPLKK